MIVVVRDAECEGFEEVNGGGCEQTLDGFAVWAGCDAEFGGGQAVGPAGELVAVDFVEWADVIGEVAAAEQAVFDAGGQADVIGDG